MRNVKVAFPVVALVLLFSVSATGQQSDSGSPSPDPKVIIQLPAEPVQPPVELTLADAARQNNFPLFEALYAKGGEENPRFSELYTFWKWSMTDRIGAFYGEDVHARFAGEYPDYASYIADYDIVDSNGHTFYPSAETRAFLLKHAIEGTAPKHRETTAVAKAKNKPAAHEIATPKPVVKAVPKAAAKPAPIVTSGAAAVPAVVDARDARRSTQPAVSPAPQPRRILLPASDHRVARGFALIVAGLIAIGVLMLMLRTPREGEPAETSNEGSVEPLRIIPLEGDQAKKTA